MFSWAISRCKLWVVVAPTVGKLRSIDIKFWFASNWFCSCHMQNIATMWLIELWSYEGWTPLLPTWCEGAPTPVFQAPQQKAWCCCELLGSIALSASLVCGFIADLGHDSANITAINLLAFPKQRMLPHSLIIGCLLPSRTMMHARNTENDRHWGWFGSWEWD